MSILHDALVDPPARREPRAPRRGMHSGLSTLVAPNFTPAKLLRDHPYGVDEVRAERDFVRKYPTGD